MNINMASKEVGFEDM